tara:strand:+ start:1916 stop:2125 length:210 start_codon:yes stop_codon:yes gene_type:complete
MSDKKIDDKKIEAIKNSEQYKFSSKRDQKKMIKAEKEYQKRLKRTMKAEGNVPENYKDQVKRKFGGGKL